MNNVRNFLTIGNFICGLLGLLLLSHEMYAGVVFILLGLFLNFIGGLSPQKLGAVSDIAKEMDSFAELVTFCIAPSILAYIVSLNTLPYIGVLCSLAFSICGCFVSLELMLNKISLHCLPECRFLSQQCTLSY